MTPLPRLSLERVEDRLLPSAFVHFGPRPTSPTSDHREAAGPVAFGGRGDDWHTPRMMSHGPSGFDGRRDFGPRPTAERGATDVAPPAAPGGTADRPAEGPAAGDQSAEGGSPPVRAESAGAIGPAPDLFATGTTAVGSAADDGDREPVVIGGPRVEATVTEAASHTFHGVAGQAAWVAGGSFGSQQPTPPFEGPPEPKPAGPPEAGPAPTLLERVVDAVLPGVTPLAGVLPLDGRAVETAAREVLGRLADLAPDLPDELTDPERWAWVAAAVLAAGGLTYTVRGRRGRRVDRASPGADTVLARWEERHAVGRD